MGEHHEEQADEDQVEHEPGDQESTPPGAQPVGRQTVTGIKVSRKLPPKSFALLYLRELYIIYGNYKPYRYTSKPTLIQYGRVPKPRYRTIRHTKRSFKAESVSRQPF